LAATQESFDALLAWLDPDDREAAGREYEVIRAGLIRICVSKGFSDAERLADDTIDRVMDRLPEIRDTYIGIKAKYFHGVLRYVIKEQRRNKEVATDEFPILSTRVPTTSNEYECLLECLKSLSRDKYDLILDYHSYSGFDKIEAHSEMADELGISENALRIRAHHARSKLKKCVWECVVDISRNKTGLGNHSYQERNLPQSVSHGSSRKE
jgi:DNA-directed RNA polymerase specialized sigma24 family protein